MAQKDETTIQNAIRAELSKVGIVRRNNVGMFTTAYGKPIAIGLPGEADLTLFYNGGKTIFIEIKTPTGRQSKQQRAFEKRVTELGFRYVILRSLSEAKEFIGEVENEQF